MAEPEFVSHCRELLAPLGAVRVRRMFGAWGLYVDDIFIAIIDADQLYLKVGAETRDRFQAAGSRPFVLIEDGKAISLSYWTAPDDALESPALMLPWGRLALQAALQARAAVKPRKRPTASPQARPDAASAAPAPATRRAGRARRG